MTLAKLSEMASAYEALADPNYEELCFAQSQEPVAE